jgi:predicted dehydrogenase
VKVGVIGAGGWGMNHVRALAALPNADLVAVADSVATRRDAAVAVRHGIRAYESAEDLLAASDVQAVVIATDSPNHARVALAALDAGKHALVEKPLALTSADARAVAERAADRGLVLMVGHLLLHHPAVQKLKTLVDAGELGDVLYVTTRRLNLGIVRREENALWSLAPHDISLLLHFLRGRAPLSVSATGAAYLQPGIEDVVFFSVEFGGGARGHGHVSWLDPRKVRELVVVGAQKMAVFDDMEAEEKIRIYDKSARRESPANAYATYGDAITLRYGDITVPYVKMTEPLRVEDAYFLDCVRERRAPELGTGADGVAVVSILEAASASLASGGSPVSLDSLLPTQAAGI